MLPALSKEKGCVTKPPSLFSLSSSNETSEDGDNTTVTTVSIDEDMDQCTKDFLKKSLNQQKDLEKNLTQVDAQITDMFTNIALELNKTKDKMNLGWDHTTDDEMMKRRIRLVKESSIKDKTFEEGDNDLQKKFLNISGDIDKLLDKMERNKREINQKRCDFNQTLDDFRVGLDMSNNEELDENGSNFTLMSISDLESNNEEDAERKDGYLQKINNNLDQMINSTLKIINNGL